MGLFNPTHALIVPAFFFITIPLAILAGITTTLAFTVLLLRFLVVYIDILISLAPRPFSRRSTPQFSPDAAAASTAAAVLVSSNRSSSSQLATATTTSPTHHRRQQSSQALANQGLASQQAVTRRRRSSTASSSSLAGEQRGLGLLPSVGPERDFEGIGGWRVGDDDDVWTTVTNPPHHHHALAGSNHGHSRSLSNGPPTPGEGYLMMKGRTSGSPRTTTTTVTSHGFGYVVSPSLQASPNSSRARTPSGPRMKFGAGQPDGYFALSRNTSPQASKRF